jgi:uncharacterized tellurite resistance protein B-like protein
MLESLKRFLSDFSRGAKRQDHFAETDYRLAAAALLIHVATIDGDMKEPARDKLHSLLQYRFDLDNAAADELIGEATRADHEAVDFYHFTKLLNRELDDDGRRRIVEMIWEMIFVDGRVTEFEDNVAWRVADLLNVSSRERIAIRRRIEAARGIAPDEPAS